MKICWDNLEEFWLSGEGNLRKGRCIYVEMEACKICGESYLISKYNQGPYCSIPCAHKDTSLYKKTMPIETRKKISSALTGIVRIWNSRSGALNNNYKGGVAKAGLTTYAANKDILGVYEDVRKQDNTEILEVKCTYCGKWFSPTNNAVNNRLKAINRLDRGECRLYCSDNCKKSCPTYNRSKYPKGFKHATSREVSTYLRQMVLERDGWICQICGNTIEKVPLHVHHMDPVTQNPLFQNDMNSCITLCKSCHKKVHRQYGCRYIDLQCKREG